MGLKGKWTGSINGQEMGWEFRKNAHLSHVQDREYHNSVIIAKPCNKWVTHKLSIFSKTLKVSKPKPCTCIKLRFLQWTHWHTTTVFSAVQCQETHSVVVSSRWNLQTRGTQFHHITGQNELRSWTLFIFIKIWDRNLSRHICPWVIIDSFIVIIHCTVTVMLLFCCCCVLLNCLYYCTTNQVHSYKSHYDSLSKYNIGLCMYQLKVDTCVYVNTMKGYIKEIKHASACYVEI